VKTRIKICGLTDEAAVEAACEAGADVIGLVLSPSSRQLAPQRAAQLASHSRLPVVAVFRHPAPELIAVTLDAFTPHAIQSDFSDKSSLPALGTIEFWPVVRGAAPDGEAALDACGLVLIEAAESGAGIRADWSRAGQLARLGRTWVAGGLTAHNVGALLRDAPVFGVDVSSGVESVPGRKDPRLIHAFVSAVRAAEYQRNPL
jgi:phosphoribosylanthranilate isomerase